MRYFFLYNDTSSHLSSSVYCYAPVLIRFLDSAKREYFNGLSSNYYRVWLSASVDKGM